MLEIGRKSYGKNMRLCIRDLYFAVSQLKALFAVLQITAAIAMVYAGAELRDRGSIGLGCLGPPLRSTA